MKALKLLIFLILFSYTARAQESTMATEPSEEEWSLSECIDYAMQHNLNIRRTLLDLQNQELSYTQAKMNILPTVNASASYNFNWGRSIDPTTNFFVDNQKVESGNASLSASYTLFNGFRLQYAITQNKYGVRSAEQTLESTKRDISLSVASYYINVLFTRELLENAKKQLNSTDQQVLNTRKQVEVGALAQSSLLDLLAQKASNESNVVNAENDYNNAIIQLKQVLQLPPANSIDIIIPEIDTAAIQPVMDMNVMEVYNVALQNWPSIRAAGFNVESSKYAVKSSVGNYYPTLTLGAGLTTRYSDVALTQLGEDYPFSDQLDDNLNKYVGATLNIPIFNGLSARLGVQRAKVTLSRAEVTYSEAEYTLWQNIEQSYNDVVAAAKSYLAAEKQVEAREESFRVLKQRYDIGAVNITDYQIGENDLFRAKSDLLRAKYDYVFKQQVLEFYQGNQIEF